jgi:triphosphatase
MTLLLSRARNPLEVELKFQLPPGSRAILEGHPTLAAASAERSHLVSTYFDTPDRALDQRGLTLRVRRDGEVRTQTVKSRSDSHDVALSRSEWEWPIDQDAPEVVWLERTNPLSNLAMAIKDRLQPVFITTISRTKRLVRLDEDTTVEVAFDEGTIEAGLAHEAVSELEIELKSGRVSALYQFAAELMSRAPLWLTSESKASRGWRLRAGQSEGAQLAQPPKLKRKVCASKGFRQIVGGTLGHLTANIGATLRGDAEGLHQSRIAIKEVRAALKLFDRYLDEDRAKRFNATLRVYAKILGATRDWDVFCLETLPAAMPDLSNERLEDLHAAAEVERQLAHEAVAVAERSREFSELVLGLLIWSNIESIESSRHIASLAHQSLSTLAPSLLDRAAGTVRRRGRHASRLSATGRHRLRKSLKKLSFDVQCLAQLYGAKGIRRYRRRCEAVEAILGAANDAVVTDRLARKLVMANRRQLTKPARALERWNKVRSRSALKGLRAAMESFRSAPGFWS